MTTTKLSAATASVTDFTLGELFCGPGGMAVATRYVAPVTGLDGHTYKLHHSWGVDFAPYAIETFKANLGAENGICRDARQFVEQDLTPARRIDALAFGFPCNSFSAVGQREGIHSAKFGDLYKTGIKVMETYDPVWFIAENVSGISGHEGGRQFRTILHDLADAGKGYDVAAHLYKFEEYGVPQSRHRYVIVGIRQDVAKERGLRFRPPAPTHGKNSPDKRPLVTAGAMLAPLMEAEGAVAKPPREKVAWRLRFTPPGENAWKLDQLVDERLYPDERLIAYLRGNLPWYETEIAPLGDAAAIRAKIEEVRLHCTRARMSHIYRRLDPNAPAYTLTGSGGGGTHVYHWAQHRALTNRERAALQTFPPDFTFCGTEEQIRRQIGMAVPTEGARQIFQAILKTFAHVDYPSVPPTFFITPNSRDLQLL